MAKKRYKPNRPIVSKLARFSCSGDPDGLFSSVDEPTLRINIDGTTHEAALEPIQALSVSFALRNTALAVLKARRAPLH